MHWFDEVMVKSGRFGPSAILLASVGGDRDEGHLLKREIATKPASDFKAVKLGESDIEQDDVRLKLQGEFKGGMAIRRGPHLKTGVPQQDCTGTDDIEVVVHDEDTDCRKCLLAVEG